MNADENAKLVCAARQAAGDWLGKVAWDCFATLTFSHDLSLTLADYQIKRWIRKIEQRAQQKIKWFYALERGGGGLLHFHVLLSGVSHLNVQAIEAAWPCGRAHVAAYDQSRGAAQYVTKQLWLGDLEYDLRLD